MESNLAFDNLSFSKSQTAKNSILEIAKRHFNLDDKGYCDWIYNDFLKTVYPEKGLYWSNGCPHIRKESSLYSTFIIEKKMEGAKLIAFKLSGYRTESFSTRESIPKFIQDKFKIHKKAKQSCIVYGCFNKAEHIDHRRGFDSKGQLENEFAFTCVFHNLFKRERCKKCKDSGIRPDSKTLDILSLNPCENCVFYDWDSKIIPYKMEKDYQNLIEYQSQNNLDK